MDESEDNMSSEDTKFMLNPTLMKVKPKKRSLVERELETNLTARVTSPVTNSECASTSRYGRTRRIKTDSDYIDTEKGIKILDSPSYEKTPIKIQSPVYKMHASNSPIKLESIETPIKSSETDSSLNNQVENIYHENASLSRFGSDEKKNKTPGQNVPKVYVRKDLIQSREKDIGLIKNMFSPAKSAKKNNSHLNNILERSSEKYSLNVSSENSKPHNGLSNSSVVKTLDFDGNKKKKIDNRDGKAMSKSDLFDLEAKCEYQVGDLAWARMGTYPFWPCIITREPASGMFVKKKLFGRIERDIVHVTFFGDNGRRGWIVDTMLRRFLGQLEFEATRESFSPANKKKDPRLYAAFFVSEKKMPQWNISVEEAETLLREPKRLRIDILYDMLARSRSAKSTPKQQKGGKIARTTSDVASDVSLSESLYDTLFSEDDGKSDDAERSRSKTRMSLDVSEVVTACLDNMAAKTGITKIQRQSHMDRWLQKAKSKTPEKTQANLPPPKEKEAKLVSAKKKKITPIIVPIQKPYSLRKTSYEPQILKSHDNEHNYSATISSDNLHTCNDVQVNADFDISFEVKVEPLQSKTDESVDEITGDQTIDIDTTDSEVLKEADSSVTSLENTNKIIEIGPIDISEDQVEEIQENLCSVEENEELLLQTEKPIEAQTVNPSSVKPENRSEIPKIPDKRTNATTLVENKLQDEAGFKDAAPMNEKEKQISVPSIPEVYPIDSKTPTRTSNRRKEKLVKNQKDSPEFIKYLELRQDALMDEHPDLSQDDIEEYLYKTWQYEESARFDFKTDDTTPVSVKSNATGKRKSKNTLSLSTNARNLSKKRDENTLSKSLILSDASVGDSISPIILPSTSKNTEITSSFSKDTRNTIEKNTQKAIEPTEKQPVKTHKPEMSMAKVFDNYVNKENTDSTPVVAGASSRKSQRLSKSPAAVKDTSKSVGKKSNTAVTIENSQTIKPHIHPETTPKLNEQNLDSTEQTLNKDTTPIKPSRSSKRSLRKRLSRSPAMSKYTAENITNLSKDCSSEKAIERNTILPDDINKPELIENKPDIIQKIDEQGTVVVKLTEPDVDKDKHDSTPIMPSTPGRKSLRNRLSRTPAMPKVPTKIITNLSKDCDTDKMIERNQMLPDDINKSELPENKPDIVQKNDKQETVVVKLTEPDVDKEKKDSTPIVPSTPGRKSLRNRSSRSSATPKDPTEMTSDTSKEINLIKVTGSDENVSDDTNKLKLTENKPEKTLKSAEQETVMLKPYTDKENNDLTPVVPSTPGRKRLRNRLSRSPAVPKDTTENIGNLNKESSTVKAIESNQSKPVLTENNLEIIPINAQPATGSPEWSKSETKMDKDKNDSTTAVASTSARKSLRIKVAISPAATTYTNEVTSSVSQESNSVKSLDCSRIIIEQSFTEKLAHKADELKSDTPNLSHKDKLKETTIVDESSVRKRLRINLSNCLATTENTDEISSASKDNNLVKTIENIDKSEKHSDTALNQNEQILESPKLLKERTKSTRIADSSVIRRLRRKKLSISQSMIMDSHELSEKKYSSLQANEIIETLNAVSQKPPDITQKLEHVLDKSEKFVDSIEKDNKETQIVKEHDSSSETSIEITQTAKREDMVRDNEYITQVDNDLKVTKEQAQTTLLKDRSLPITNQNMLVSSDSMNAEKVTDIIQVFEKPKINSEKSFEFTPKSGENCVNTEEQTNLNNQTDLTITDAKVIEVPTTMAESRQDTEINVHIAQTDKPSEISKSSDQTRIYLEKPPEKPTVNGLDTENKTGIDKNVDNNSVAKLIEITHYSYETKQQTDKQVDITVDANETVKDEIPDEDKEYGHLDFVFSVLDEKLLSSDDVNKPVIANIATVSNTGATKYFETTKSTEVSREKTECNNIDSKCDNNTTNLCGNVESPGTQIDKTLDSLTITKEVQIKNEESVEDFVKRKYKNLYDSCTALKVSVKRLPRLSHKIIKINDLDKEISINNAGQKNNRRKRLSLNKKLSIIKEKTHGHLTENGHNKSSVDSTAEVLSTRRKSVKDVDIKYLNDTTAGDNKTSDDLIKNKQVKTCTDTTPTVMPDETECISVATKNTKDCQYTHANKERQEHSNKDINDKTCVANTTDDDLSSKTSQESLMDTTTAASKENTKYISENNNDKVTIATNINNNKQNGDTTVDKVNNNTKSIEDESIVNSEKNTDKTKANAIEEKLTKRDTMFFDEFSGGLESKQIIKDKTTSSTTIKESKEIVEPNPRTAIAKSESVKTLQVKPCPIANKNIVPKVDFRPVAAKPDQIKPTALSNGYDYLYDDDDDDDEEEFESPAFSPIFKEPIEPEKKPNEDSSVIHSETTDKSTTSVDISLPKDAVKSPLPKESILTKEDKIQEVITNNEVATLMMEEKGANKDKDEIMTSVSRLPEPVKINGFHLDEYGLDCSDNDFNVETSSINSEDSEPLSVTKSKLRPKNRKNDIKADGKEHSEFVKYLELRQDALMDEHPELNQDEIVDYLYKTWQYEENSKSEIRKNDDIEQAVLVKGLNDNLRQKSMRNRYRENKKRSKKVDDDTLSITSNSSRKQGKKGDEDTLSIDSDVSDSSTRRRLRRRLSNSPALSLDENEFSISKESSPERKPDISDKRSMDSDDFIKITKRKVRNQILDDDADEDDPIIKEEAESKDESHEQVTAKTKESRPKRTAVKSNKSPTSHKESNIRKYFGAVNSESIDSNEQQSIDVNQIKEEPDPDTISMTSINSEDSEVSLSKRKQRKEKQSAKSMEDPEFLKYVELRQDILIDENPQLTHDEIVAYLYKTWLYEESVKSDLKKSDDIEQANLVKGLNSEVQPKKVRKKIKTEKILEEETKEKPKRKTYQPYYNEDTISDIEDEIELFEIFRTNKKNSVQVKSEQIAEATKSNEVTSTENETAEETDVLDVIDEIELYFSQLPQPKPNVFKGLVREKVCEICEKTGNLVKCKGCSGMFHVDCQKKDLDKESVTCTRGRKKKKKPGRKPKNLDDSGSHSDEKSQDVSEENNASIEEVEPEPRVVDEAVIEAVLTAKMQEILPTIDLTYDSFSSDDGLDWNSAPPGQCEIVDVKMKPKIVDYSDFKCSNCQIHSTPVCFVCKNAVSKTGVEPRQKCHSNHCNKYYHLECLDHWPQTQFSGDLSKKKNNEKAQSVTCPRHVCHTCVSDDPRGCKTRFSGDKLARCVRCPATYHSFTKCLPAGSQILTGSLIVCPRHYDYDHRPGKVPCHVNTGWCFICALGGSLICCEYCPTSFHAECLNIKPPEGGYMCEDCETGRLPLYGEMVWVKLGHYRWWPAIILHPSEIPENLLAVKHAPGEFVVRFFGQYDHYWVNRGRVFPFQEGDSGRISTQKSKIDNAFITAMEHAHRAFEILKTAKPNDEESMDIASSLLPPHYVKLKVNKPCGSLIGRRPDIEESSLTQCECDPLVEDPCGPYSHCLNRMLLTECGPICRAGDRCSNRAFEKRLYPKMAPYRTPHRGWGLKTLEDIRAGQFVIEYVGELIDEEEFRRRMNRMHEIRDENFYFLTLDKERMIDAGPKGNLARFMNHCCEPNCETQKWTVLGDVRVGLFAINDIPANSELTFNYNLECAGIEKKRCLCGARRCSGYIGAKPKQIEETQPKKKRAYKKRAKPAEDTAIKNKPKRPVGRPPKPRELTEIEKDLLIIKNATNDISSDSEASSRLSSIDNPNPKALKRKRVSFSTEESLCSSPSSRKSKDESPSSRKFKNDEFSSPNTKKAKMDDFTSPSTKKTKVDECTTPSTSKTKLEDTVKPKIECTTPSTSKTKFESVTPSTNKTNLEENECATPCSSKTEMGDLEKPKIDECTTPSNSKTNIEDLEKPEKDECIAPKTSNNKFEVKEKADNCIPSNNKAKFEDSDLDLPIAKRMKIEAKSEVGD